jgi:hypothetical protein
VVAIVEVPYLCNNPKGIRTFTTKGYKMNKAERRFAKWLSKILIDKLNISLVANQLEWKSEKVLKILTQEVRKKSYIDCYLSETKSANFTISNPNKIAAYVLRKLQEEIPEW